MATWDGTFWQIHTVDGVVELTPVGPGFRGYRDIQAAFRRAKELAGWKEPDDPIAADRLRRGLS